MERSSFKRSVQGSVTSYGRAMVPEPGTVLVEGYSARNSAIRLRQDHECEWRPFLLAPRRPRLRPHWKSDGTVSGTPELRRDIPVYPGVCGAYLPALTAAGGLSVLDLRHRRGRRSGEATARPRVPSWSRIALLRGRVGVRTAAVSTMARCCFFQEFNDWPSSCRHELWRSDGTESGTVFVDRCLREGTHRATVGDTLFFGESAVEERWYQRGNCG